eukprot:gene11740-8077_t
MPKDKAPSPPAPPPPPHTWRAHASSSQMVQGGPTKNSVMSLLPPVPAGCAWWVRPSPHSGVRCALSPVLPGATARRSMASHSVLRRACGGDIPCTIGAYGFPWEPRASRECGPAGLSPFIRFYFHSSISLIPFGGSVPVCGPPSCRLVALGGCVRPLILACGAHCPRCCRARPHGAQWLLIRCSAVHVAETFLAPLEPRASRECGPAGLSPFIRFYFHSSISLIPFGGSVPVCGPPSCRLVALGGCVRPLILACGAHCPRCCRARPHGAQWLLIRCSAVHVAETFLAPLVHTVSREPRASRECGPAGLSPFIRFYFHSSISLIPFGGSVPVCGPPSCRLVALGGCVRPLILACGAHCPRCCRARPHGLLIRCSAVHVAETFLAPLVHTVSQEPRASRECGPAGLSPFIRFYFHSSISLIPFGGSVPVVPAGCAWWVRPSPHSGVRCALSPVLPGATARRSMASHSVLRRACGGDIPCTIGAYGFQEPRASRECGPAGLSPFIRFYFHSSISLIPFGGSVPVCGPPCDDNRPTIDRAGWLRLVGASVPSFWRAVRTVPGAAGRDRTALNGFSFGAPPCMWRRHSLHHWCIRFPLGAAGEPRVRTRGALPLHPLLFPFFYFIDTFWGLCAGVWAPLVPAGCAWWVRPSLILACGAHCPRCCRARPHGAQWLLIRCSAVHVAETFLAPLVHTVSLGSRGRAASADPRALPFIRFYFHSSISLIPFGGSVPVCGPPSCRLVALGGCVRPLILACGAHCPRCCRARPHGAQWLLIRCSAVHVAETFLAPLVHTVSREPRASRECGPAGSPLHPLLFPFFYFIDTFGALCRCVGPPRAGWLRLVGASVPSFWRAVRTVPGAAGRDRTALNGFSFGAPPCMWRRHSLHHWCIRFLGSRGRAASADPRALPFIRFYFHSSISLIPFGGSVPVCGPPCDDNRPTIDRAGWLRLVGASVPHSGVRCALSPVLPGATARRSMASHSVLRRACGGDIPCTIGAYGFREPRASRECGPAGSPLHPLLFPFFYFIDTFWGLCAGVWAPLVPAGCAWWVRPSPHSGVRCALSPVLPGATARRSMASHSVLRRACGGDIPCTIGAYGFPWEPRASRECGPAGLSPFIRFYFHSSISLIPFGGSVPVCGPPSCRLVALGGCVRPLILACGAALSPVLPGATARRSMASHSVLRRACGGDIPCTIGAYGLPWEPRASRECGPAGLSPFIRFYFHSSISLIPFGGSVPVCGPPCDDNRPTIDRAGWLRLVGASVPSFWRAVQHCPRCCRARPHGAQWLLIRCSAVHVAETFLAPLVHTVSLGSRGRAASADPRALPFIRFYFHSSISLIPFGGSVPVCGPPSCRLVALGGCVRPLILACGAALSPVLPGATARRSMASHSVLRRACGGDIPCTIGAYGFPWEPRASRECGPAGLSPFIRFYFHSSISLIPFGGSVPVCGPPSCRLVALGGCVRPLILACGAALSPVLPGATARRSMASHSVLRRACGGDIPCTIGAYGFPWEPRASRECGPAGLSPFIRFYFHSSISLIPFGGSVPVCGPPCDDNLPVFVM